MTRIYIMSENQRDDYRVAGYLPYAVNGEGLPSASRRCPLVSAMAPSGGATQTGKVFFFQATLRLGCATIQ